MNLDATGRRARPLDLFKTIVAIILALLLLVLWLTGNAALGGSVPAAPAADTTTRGGAPSALPPTEQVALAPTAQPTAAPATQAPAPTATAKAVEPTAAPTAAPTATSAPTATVAPTVAPTTAPTAAPTALPTASPTSTPTEQPTPTPTTAAPTAEPAATATPAPAATSTTEPTAAQGQAGEEIYTIKPGDTLYALAQRYYGNGALWKRIYDATIARAATDPTFAVIGSTRALRPGQKVVIPPKP